MLTPDIDTTLTVSLVPHFNIRALWPEVAHHLKRATDMSEGRYTLADLKDKLLSSEFNLWIVIDVHRHVVAAITSTFTLYPTGKKVVHGQFLGGDRLEDWQDMFCDILDNWGRDNGCTAVEFTGRAGWSKPLSRNGYREIYRVYERDLT